MPCGGQGRTRLRGGRSRHVVAEVAQAATHRRENEKAQADPTRLRNVLLWIRQICLAQCHRYGVGYYPAKRNWDRIA